MKSTVRIARNRGAENIRIRIAPRIGAKIRMFIHTRGAKIRIARNGGAEIGVGHDRGATILIRHIRGAKIFV